MKGKPVQIFAFISVIASLLWAGGLGWAVYDYFNGTANPGPQDRASQIIEEDQDGIEVLTLGDSLTRGTGDATGKGYVGHLMDKFKENSNRQFFLYNYGIKGQTSVQLAQQIKQKEIQRQVKKADIVLITIGGNDLFRGGQTLEKLDLKEIKRQELIYLKNLDAILSNLRGQNPNAKIFLFGLYNPFNKLADSDITSKVVRDWNNKTEELSTKYPQTVLVPTYDLFQLNPDSYLYTDKFHPNTKGYKLMADRVASLVTW